MWVFGYGSLMWDRWETRFNGARVDHAVLRGFRRSFNKKSVKNWGSSMSPCPTLGLEPDETGSCVGTAFEFPDASRENIIQELRQREGSSFTLQELIVMLPDRREVHAVTSVNDRASATYLGHVSLQDRTAMARTTTGKSGSCREYVLNLHQMLHSLGISDRSVDEFFDQINT